jgi:8-oxo-dGTP pyrophosphatase MutT (NUDIX family)
MPAPDFVLALRERIGHDLLWMPGVTALVLDAGRLRLLVVRRADNGAWTPVTGIIDPGEQPAHAAVREVHEEAGIVAEAERLVAVRSGEPTTHVNGDHAQYLDLCFLLTHVTGDPYPADGENTQARWAPLDDLPPMAERFTEPLQYALHGPTTTAFLR